MYSDDSCQVSKAWKTGSSIIMTRLFFWGFLGEKVPFESGICFGEHFLLSVVWPYGSLARNIKDDDMNVVIFSGLRNVTLIFCIFYGKLRH